MATVDVGLIGVGSMGQALASLVQGQSNAVRFNALYDPEPKAVKHATGLLGFSGAICDSDAGVITSECDWVMIASWNCFHAAQTIAAFEAGKHVFCQKPLATTLDDCLAMRDAWRETDRHFVIGFTLRYSPHYRRLKELVSEGAIGDIVSVDLTETLGFNHGGYIMGDWRRLKQNAGSHVLEKCCHDIDILNWLVESRAARVASFGGLNFFTPGNERHISRLGENAQGREAYRVRRGLVGEHPFRSDKDIVDNQVVILEYENEVRATFHMNSNSGIPERRIHLVGTEGTIRADVITGRIELQRIGFDTTLEDHSGSAVGMHGGGDEVLAAELIDLMTGQRASNAGAGLDEGLAAAVTCFAIDDAMESGEVVSLSDYWRAVDRS